MFFLTGLLSNFLFCLFKRFTEFQLFTVHETPLNKNYLIVFNALDKTISFKSSKFL